MTLDRERWQRLSALLDEALALAPPARAAWLADWRTRDAALAAELQALLPAAANGGGAPTAPTALAGFDALLGQALEPATPAADGVRPGRRFGAWQLLHKIGEGGMGQVWLARRADGLYEAQAAIKLLRSDLLTAGLRARFARERAVLARLNHPAVARLLDAGVEQVDSHEQAWLVLEFVDGAPLAEHARRACPSVAARVRLFLRVAEAVDHAHAQLIVHRDLKPSNVLVRPDGTPKLLDFGIAGLLDDEGDGQHGDITRQTGRGLTLGYAAPEQILGAPIGTAADVFSLGVVLYELLSGTLPFAPRGTPRLAAERAVLHDEPRRLSAVLARAGSMSEADLEFGPGRPQDTARIAGDLEAVVAKALRKTPDERYGSVRALMDDLQAWLAHRPVGARRDDWRHRTHLWVQRNAWLALGLLAVGLSLTLGLAGATWQWRRAEAAARQSDQVTHYLAELLASASPERHGGSWPTVLQLLESARSTLPQQFADAPQTRARLLRVMADTYHELNRFDVAIPLYAELLAAARREHGEHDRRTLELLWRQARAHQVQGQFDKAITLLEPQVERFRQEFGEDSEDHRLLLYVLSTSYARAGRLDDADRMLAAVGRITERLFAPGSRERLSHLNHLQVLRVGQGRLREGLAALQATERWWNDPVHAGDPLILVLRRNMIAVQIRLSEYQQIEERTRVLLAEMEKLIGPGNDMAAGLRQELARYYTESGQPRPALIEREDILRRALAAGVQHPAVLLPARVQVLLARAQAAAAPPATLVAEARALLAELAQHADEVGYARGDARLHIARTGLLLDDAALAAEALAALRADAGLRLAEDRLLDSRATQLEGGLARLQGDLPRSQALLERRLQGHERPGADRQTLPAWVSALDLAYTRVLQGGEGAAAALAAAATRRPAGLPAGHPLDAATAWLQARQQAGRDDAPEVQAAAAALRRAQGRLASPQPPGRGSLDGALI